MFKTNPKTVLVTAIAFGLVGTNTATAQVFYQNFDIADPMNPQPGCNIGDFPGGAGTYPFPVDWLKFNVDGRTPNALVSYVNEAWEVREDFSFNVSECAAFSTSWYTPAGVADDWTWTPAITLPAGVSTLSWRAVTYDASYRDGYEVRVKTGAAPTLANQTMSDVVFSTPAENTAWTQRTFNLAAYGGQTVYVGFHNNSNDKFLLLIDDVRILDTTPNLTAASTVPSSSYSRVPVGVSVDAAFAVNASNVGGSDLTNVMGTATLKLDGNPVGMPISSTVVPMLAIGASTPLTFSAPPALNSSGVWTVEYNLSAAQTPSELNALDNVIASTGTAIGGNEFARHEGAVSGTLGIGAGNGGEIGTQFTLVNTATFEGVRFSMGTIPPAVPPDTDPDWAGRSVVANLRAFNAVTNKPDVILATTNAITSTMQGGTYDVEFATGPQTLMPGTYVVTVVEPTGGSAMPLQLSVDRFTPGTTWVNWPTSPLGEWGNMEAFGTGFERAPHVSLLEELSIFKDGFEGTGQAVGNFKGTMHTDSSLIQTRPLRRGQPKHLQLAKPDEK